MRKRSLSGNEGGAAAVEFALAFPVLISFVWGIFQLGLIFQAQTGMQHALGEGARLATLFPAPSDAAIKARISAKTFGTGLGTFTVSDPVNGAGFKTLTVSYTVTPNFLFFTAPPLTLTQSKKVYIAVAT